MRVGARVPALRHTWLFQPGRWTAAGRFWAEGELEREARGTSIIRHAGTVWEIEGRMEIDGEPPLRFRNDYRLDAPGANARVLPWRSHNPAIGPLTGLFFVEDDAIMSAFQGDDGSVGSEHMTRLAPDRYRARGLFLRSGAIVSAWSMDLVRQA